jgi:heme/copper-type cytochrome/quinol oxidase subunit 2
MGAWILIALLMAFLGSAVWLAFESWNLHDDIQMSGHAWAAMILGVVFSLALGLSLMALVFYSSRRGYDRPPQRETDPPVQTNADDTA